MMNSKTCIIPQCKGLRWSTAGRCHTHAGAQEQWLDNIMASSGTTMVSLAPKASKKKQQKASSGAPVVGGSSKVPSVVNSGLNFSPPQHLPLQSGLGLSNLQYMGLPGVDPRVALALSTGQSPVLPAVYHTKQQLAANRLQESLYPDQALYTAGPSVAMLPHLCVPSPSLRGVNREVEANCDPSVFKLTPGHKRGTVVPDGDSTHVSDGDPTNNDSQRGQDSRSWHAPDARVSAEVHQDPSVVQQRQIDSEGQNNSIEGSFHRLHRAQPKPGHTQQSVSQHLQAERCSVQKSSSRPHRHVQARQEDHIQDLPSQQQQTWAREHVSHHPSTQCPRHQGTRNSNRLSRSSESSEEDVILVGVDEDVLIVGEDKASVVTKCENTVNKNIKSSKSVQSSASDQQALPSSSVGSDSDDDFIVLDLSDGPAYEPENIELQNSGVYTVESLEEQSQGERSICEQVLPSALSTGQNRTSRQSTETAEPSQIMVLETVSLSEQQSVCLDQDATPKTYRQLSTESYYCCGCLKGGCGFRTVLPTQLELHLQEEHPYDVIYPCVHCGSREAGIHSLISHLEQHLAPQDLSLHCSDPSCEFLSFSPEEVLSHIRLCHPKQADHICWRCSKKFDSLAMFCLHVQQNLLSVVRCQLCSARDVDRQGILMHMASSHPDQDHLIAVQKVLICLERKVNHWDTDDNADDLTVMKTGYLLMSGNDDDEVHSVGSKQIGIISPMTNSNSISPARQDESVPHEQPLSPENQEKESQGSGTPTQKLKTSKKEDAIGSPSKGRQLGRTKDETINTSPSVKDKPTGTNTTADARKAKLSHTNSSCAPTIAKPSDTNTTAAAEKANLSHPSASHTAVKAKPPGTNTTLAVVIARPAMKITPKQQNHTRPATETTPEKQNHVHSAHQIDLSESSELCARMESGALESTEDVVDSNEKSADRGTQEKESVMHTPSPSAASEEDANDGIDSEPETEVYSWIDYTYSRVEMEKFGCSFCDYKSRFLDDHVKHIHSSHASHFKGFACRRCGFISIDQNAESEHRCDGSRHLRARSRIWYSEDDSTFNKCSAPAVRYSSSAGMENHVKTRLKRKLLESFSPSKRARSSESEDSVASPPKVVSRSETGGISSPSSKQTSSPEMGSAASSESSKRLSGVELVCNVCGLRGSSRSGMQHHMYSQHADIMACPVCSETLDSDRQLQRHLSDLHPDQCSAFERMKSQNFITHVSASHRREDDGKDASAVLDRQLDSVLPNKKFKCELLACKLCGFSCRNPSLLKNHIYSKHPQVGKCPKCDVHLTGDRKLYRHLHDAHYEEKDSLYQQHESGSWIFKPDNTSQLFLCKLCGFSITQSYDVQKHMYTEHKDIMKCPKCFVELGSDQELYQHLSDDHADDRDVLYSQHCSISLCDILNSGDGPKEKPGEVGDKPREWVVSHTSDKPTLLRIKKGSPRKTSPRSKLSKQGAGKKNIVSSTSSSTAKAGAFPQSDLTERIPLILTGELNSEVPVTFSKSCSEMSMSVPLMTRQQYDEVAAQEVIENMEYRCPHCPSDFKWRYKFYEHLCYHYHYRCFQCAHCPFLAFSGSSIVNHSRKTHNEVPSVQHLPISRFEIRIEGVINRSLVCVTDPYTERRLLAYERVRQKKLQKRQQAKSTQRVKKLTKSTSQSKQKQELTLKNAEVFSKTMMTENTMKSPKRGRGMSRKVTWQSNNDSEDQVKWLKCPYCRSKRKTKQAVGNEIRFHIHYKPYVCPYCQLSSSSEKHVKQHIASKHPQEAVVVNYEKIEQKEMKFQDLFNRAVELSRMAAKTDLMSSVKRKYMKKTDTLTAGKTNGKTDQHRVKRICRNRTTPVSASQMDPANSSGKELKTTTDKQVGQEPEIQCAHCSFVSKNRDAVKSHIIECHQDLLREGMNTGVHKDTSSFRGSLLGRPSTLMDSSSQPPSMENADIGHIIGASQSSFSPEDAQPSAQNKSISSTENQKGSHTSSD